MYVWWKSWGTLVHRLLALGASFASLVALLFPFLPARENLPGWAILLAVSAFFFFFLLVVLEVREYRSRKVFLKTDTAGIKQYMHSWIEHGGRVAIWSRDLSWADNPDTRNLLRVKAERQELILCLPERNDLATELAGAGAEVCSYGAARLESPASRFTITSFGRNGARLAVGRAQGDTHVIEEFDSNGHPAFHLAEDLIALARALN
jgi:hypothetical protein